jgi:hypothetical protein
LSAIKVYIASPYTLGDVAVNVKLQIDTATELINRGYVPFAPLLCHFIHLVHPQPYDVWSEWCFEWVKQCDVLLRLGDLSKGADNEVDLARAEMIPVYYSLTSLYGNMPVARKDN